MRSRVWQVISERRGPSQHLSIFRNSCLSIVLLAFSGASASSQARPSQVVKTKSPVQEYVSTNQLLTPEKAKRALEKSRENFLLGHLDQAFSDAQRALDMFPRCAIAFSMQGAVNLSRTHFAEAGRDFQQAIDADPTLGAAYLGLGMVLIAQGRSKEALVPLGRASTFLPNASMVYFQTAIAHLGIGEPEAALKEIAYAEQFIGSDPERRSEVSYLRGVVFLQMKDLNRYKKELLESVQRDPNGAYAALARKRLKEVGPLEDNQQLAHSTVRDPF